MDDRTPRTPRVRTRGAAAGIAVILGLSVSGSLAESPIPPQPVIGARAKGVLTVDGLRFKDANGNGQLDPYEDWRLDARARARDLVARMTLDEKAGTMLIDSLSPDFGGDTHHQPAFDGRLPAGGNAVGVRRSQTRVMVAHAGTGRRTG